MDKNEDIVMTPLRATSGTLVRFQRMASSKIDRKNVHHMAGGPYKGIVISKAKNDKADPRNADNAKGFTAYLSPTDDNNTANIKEKRNLRFWFRKHVKASEIEEQSNDFFKALMNLQNFPRDNVSFVKRALTLFKDYDSMIKLELEMRPPHPNEPDDINDEVQSSRKQVRRSITRTIIIGKQQESNVRTTSVDGVKQEVIVDQSTSMKPSVSKKPLVKRMSTLRREGQAIFKAALKKKILDTLEDVYPNSVSAEEIIHILQDAGNTTLTTEIATEILEDLSSRGLVQEVGRNRYMRVQTHTQNDSIDSQGHHTTDRRNITSQHEIQLVKNIPILSGNEQPTVAIVTLLYCEKLAVDAMIENKTTYVKYKTEGEGQVYTLGNIGSNKVVCTKLPRTGHGEDAIVAAGNSVTRLLGTFSKIESVLMVGVGGGVPCYDEDKKHVRLGDVVVSFHTKSKKNPIYIHCNTIEEGPKGKIFHTQSWASKSNTLHEIFKAIEKEEKSGNPVTPWRAILQEKLQKLEDSETRFYRPSAKTDQLQRSQDGCMQDVDHPPAKQGSFRHSFPEQPKLHFGCVGSGQGIALDDTARQMFAAQNSVKALDCGFHAVMESVDGNRIDGFAVIRGISDYFDGSRKKEWQPYCALAAAAFARQVVQKLPSSTAL